MDVSDGFTENKFIDTIKLQNLNVADLIDSGETFNDIYINEKANSAVFNVTVSEKIRELIKKKGNRLFLGLSSCRVKDKIHISRCRKCHDPSHIANRCEKPEICGYCASDTHKSDDCPLKRDLVANRNKLLCINCTL